MSHKKRNWNLMFLSFHTESDGMTWRLKNHQKLTLLLTKVLSSLQDWDRTSIAIQRRLCKILLSQTESKLSNRFWKWTLVCWSIQCDEPHLIVFMHFLPDTDLLAVQEQKEVFSVCFLDQVKLFVHKTVFLLVRCLQGLFFYPLFPCF